MAQTMSERIKAMRDQLKKRTEDSYKRKDEFGPDFTFFKKDVTISSWRPKAGVHVIDIIPFIAGPQMPIEPYTPEGDLAYVLDIFVHMRVGGGDVPYVCLSKNYREPCPICEHQKELRQQDDYDGDLVKSLYPKRRCVYNVICYDTDDEIQKGIQVFEIAHFYMEKHLVPLALDQRTKEFLPFADPINGKSIQFECKIGSYEFKKADGTTGKGKAMEFFAHKFLDRDYEIPDGDLDAAHQLDLLVHKPTYEEVYEAYWGDKPGEAEKPATRRTAGRRPTNAANEAKPPAATSSNRRKPGTRSQPKSEQAKKESPAPAPAKDESGCPAGGKFGEDIDQLAECNECEIYDRCATRNDELQDGGPAQAAPPPGEEEKKPEETPAPSRRRRRPVAG